METVIKEDINFLEEISNFTSISKYSRYDEKKKRRETFEEAIHRVERMHLRRFAHLEEKHLKEIEWAFELAKQKFWLPSGRSMQFGGKAIEAKHPRIFNCAVRHVDSLRSFSEIFFLLLCGCGVGIGLNKRFLDRLPNLVNKRDKNGIVTAFKVADTIEGWADSIEVLLQHYMRNTPYTGRKIIFDYSAIRPAGSPLKTGGGKAPGHEGLKKAHNKIKKHLDFIIEEQNQSRLKSIDVYDILMHCADAVLSGGVRRSATSVIFQPDDVDMMNAKTYFTIEKIKRNLVLDEEKNVYCAQIRIGKKLHDIEIPNTKEYEYDLKLFKEQKKISWNYVEPQRGRSNNSVILIRKSTTKEQFEEIINKTKQFGEPGFVFAEDPYMLFNPCQPAWASILTKTGIKKMEQISIGDEIWSETGWVKVSKKWSTGIKKVFKYSTSSGVFYGTETHKVVSDGEKVEAGNAESIDCLVGEYKNDVSLNPQDIIDGLIIGDGTVHKASNNLVTLCIGEKDGDYFSSEVKDYLLEKRDGVGPYSWEVNTTIISTELGKTHLRSIPERFIYGDRDKACGFLRGLYSANGSICGGRITLKTSSSKLREQVQLMLSSVGIKSYFTSNKEHNVNFSNGDYICKESYDVNITSDIEKFYKTIGFIQQYKMEIVQEAMSKRIRPSNGKKTFDIISTEFISEEEVFDITVDNSPHTYWTGGVNVSNCFEVGFIPITHEGLCGVQFCNLTTINGSKIDTKEKFKQAVKAATIAGTLQATYTDFPYLNKASEDLTKEESLLGVSITGLMDNPEILLNKDLQEEMAQYAIKVNVEWAKILNIRPAARITLVKPEGTSSLVLGSSSGIHPHHAKRYFRRIQCNKMDNVYRYFKSINPHACEESVWSANKTDDVVTFPIEVNTKAKFKNDFTALEHLRTIKSTQQHWVVPGTSDENKKPISHNVSCTVIVKEEEWKEVIEYIFDNKKYFSAVSFLSAMSDKQYKQAPLEAIITPEDEIKWTELITKWKKVEFKEMQEEDDETMLQQEGSCYGGACDIVKI